MIGLAFHMLKEKEEDLAKKLGNLSFVVTDGWLHNGRHDIKLGTNGLMGRSEVQTYKVLKNV